MPDARGALAGAGSPRRRERRLPVVHRAVAWLLWWTLLMTFWVLLDDSIGPAELLAGAGAAALAAFVAEVVTYQADSYPRLRVEWLGPALRLPWQVVLDTGTVFRVLWRYLTAGRAPDSGFRELPAGPAAGTPDPADSVTGRALRIVGGSVAPNTIVLGLDPDRGVLQVHQLQLTGEGRR